MGWKPRCCSTSFPLTDKVSVMLAGAASGEAMRGPRTRPSLNIWSASSSGKLACSGAA
ncbi:hypothetical protein D3C77_590880 [compost metagenome]